MALSAGIAVVVAYLVGGIPFGYLIGRLYEVDIRSVGSGNIGATNVWRVLGPIPGVVVLLLDVAKGYVPVLFFTSPAMGEVSALAVGLAAIIGHVASPFLRFRGGKAVATSLGVMLGLTPLVAAIALVAFLVCLFVSRYVSLSSIMGALTAAVSVQWLSDSAAIRVVYVAVAVLLIYRHRSNVQRLFRGEEPKFRFSSRNGRGDDSA